MFSSGTRRKLGHKNETLLERTKQCLWSHMKTSRARRHSYLLASLFSGWEIFQEVFKRPLGIFL